MIVTTGFHAVHDNMNKRIEHVYDACTMDIKVKNFKGDDINHFRAKSNFVRSIRDNASEQIFYASLKTQLEKFKEHITDSSFYTSLYKSAIVDVLDLGLTLDKVSITRNNSIVFYLSLKESFKLSFEVFREELLVSVVYSLYLEDDLVQMNSGSIEAVKNEIIETAFQSSSPTRNFADISNDTRYFEFQY